MARITEEQSCKNAPAFLDLIAWGEGTSTSKITANDGYDVIVAGIPPSLGQEVFTDYSRHPFALGLRAKLIRRGWEGHPGDLLSDASGRYQIILPTWRELAAKLGLRDFTPLSQDLACLELLRERHDATGSALAHVAAGDIRNALRLASAVWASMPGSTAGQRNAASPDLGRFLAAYETFTARYEQAASTLKTTSAPPQTT